MDSDASFGSTGAGTTGSSGPGTEPDPSSGSTDGGTTPGTSAGTDETGSSDESSGSTDDTGEVCDDPDGELLWWSSFDEPGDWSDGGKWQGDSQWVQESTDTVGVIVAPGGRLSPTPNVALIAPSNELDSWLQMQPAEPSEIPAVGDSITWRWYMRVVLPDTWNLDDLTHGMGLGSMTSPSDAAILNFYTTADGRWRPEVVPQLQPTEFGSVPFATGEDWENAVWLEKDAWYRLEWSVHHTEGGFTMDFNIYDREGALVVETADFNDWPFSEGYGSLAGSEFVNDIREQSRRFVGFLNGLAGLNQSLVFAEFAAVAAVRGTYVGPYCDERGW